MIRLALFTLFVLILAHSAALADETSPHELSISLREAESKALAYSNRVKASQADEASAHFQNEAQFQTLLPRLSFQANYQYFNEVPQIVIALGQRIGFGTNNVYSVGPVLSYTLFDASSSRKAYQATTLLEQARKHDRDSTELQLLLSARAAYVQVQLGLEELKAIHDSWQLAEAQRRDVAAKFHAGAASRLELVTAERSVLSYQIQFKQRQSELSGSLRDLLAQLGDQKLDDHALEQPGPAGLTEVKYVLRLDPLSSTLAEQSKLPIPNAEAEDPQIKSLLTQSDALKKSAEGQAARSYPTVQVSASVNYLRPNVPNPITYWQESFAASLSLPLFLGDPSRAQASQIRAQAESIEFRAAQRQEDVRRDYQKALDAIDNLKDQRKLALLDVQQSEEQARLYYTSYRAGKINLIDVQNANVQALQAKVHAARIDAQIIDQIILLRSLGETKGSL